MHGLCTHRAEQITGRINVRSVLRIEQDAHVRRRPAFVVALSNDVSAGDWSGRRLIFVRLPAAKGDARAIAMAVEPAEAAELVDRTQLARVEGHSALQRDEADRENGDTQGDHGVERRQRPTARRASHNTGAISDRSSAIEVELTC